MWELLCPQSFAFFVCSFNWWQGAEEEEEAGMLSVQAICDDIIITTTTTQYSTAKGQRKTIARPSKILLEIKNERNVQNVLHTRPGRYTT